MRSINLYYHFCLICILSFMWSVKKLPRVAQSGTMIKCFLKESTIRIYSRQTRKIPAFFYFHLQIHVNSMLKGRKKGKKIEFPNHTRTYLSCRILWNMSCFFLSFYLSFIPYFNHTLLFQFLNSSTISPPLLLRRWPMHFGSKWGKSGPNFFTVVFYHHNLSKMISMRRKRLFHHPISLIFVLSFKIKCFTTF